jgi:hypothetical protein
VTLDEIKSKLESAMKVRIPQFDPNLPPREKISKLEDHILLVAWHRGELEEALHWCIEAGKKLRVEWDQVQGYEVGLPSRPTKEQIDLSKGRIAPELYASLEQARTLTTSIRRQIDRLGGSDYDAASRAYSLLSGS